MFSREVEKALNGQINTELYSAYLYLSMSAYFESVNLRGLAKWMRVQASEEQAHAMKLFEHITQRGGKIALQGIDKPPSTWKSALAVFEDAYKHEQKVTGLIDGLVKTARTAKDNATEIFLQWYVTEQVEEEASTSDVAQKLKLVGDSINGLFMLDHYLGQRE